MNLQHIKELLPKHSKNIWTIFWRYFWMTFTVYNDMESHLQKLKLCFQKCREHNISLNPNKCAFMAFSRMILYFIVSKEGKLPYSKKIEQ
jgi:hypothetical protein